MNTIRVIRGSVVHADTDAIVNAANDRLAAGGGVCGAIFAAAGRAELTQACRAIGRCPTGSAVVTPGFGCRARYIIHAVGPVYHGAAGDEKLLADAYRSCLARADELGLASIGLCSLSTGIFGYPLREAAPIALRVLRDTPLQHVKDIRMYCFGEEEYRVFSRLNEG